MKSAVVFMAFFALSTTLNAQNVTLPDVNTNEGLLSHLFIAESLTPAFSQYDADAVKKGMEAMKAVIDNRLNNKPERFGASGATTYVDIVTASGQFQGFTKDSMGKIELSTAVKNRISEVLTQANTGAPGKYAAFCNNAIAIAKAPISDPFKSLTKVGEIKVTGGAYGWRKSGSGDPGGLFIAVPKADGGIISGNQFYTLKKE